VPEHVGEVAVGNLNVGLPRLLRLLREGVKHVDCFRELRHVENPVLAFLVNSDFHYPRPHG